jgi:hypothetical protein
MKVFRLMLVWIVDRFRLALRGVVGLGRYPFAKPVHSFAEEVERVTIGYSVLSRESRSEVGKRSLEGLKKFCANPNALIKGSLRQNVNSAAQSVLFLGPPRNKLRLAQLLALHLSFDGIRRRRCPVAVKPRAEPHRAKPLRRIKPLAKMLFRESDVDTRTAAGANESVGPNLTRAKPLADPTGRNAEQPGKFTFPDRVYTFPHFTTSDC